MLFFSILLSFILCMLVVSSLFGLVGWATRWKPLKMVSFELRLALCLGVLIQTAMIAGLLGFYHWFPTTLLVIACVAGLRFKPWKEFKVSGSWIWLAFPALYFVVRLVSTTLPHQHSDPLYYHLYAPKFWASLGAIRVDAAHPSFSQATFAEALYGWGQLLMVWAEQTQRDIVALLLAQQMHVILGQVLTVYVGARVIAVLRQSKDLDARDLCFSWFASVPYFFEWSGGVAKTDYFLALFTVAALLAVLLKNYFVVGLLLGFAYATKIFAIWTIAVLPVVLPFRYWKLASLGFLCGAGPVIFRNILFFGNPLFPALDDVFGPGWISKKWAASNAGFAGFPSLPTNWSWYERQVFMKPSSYVLAAAFLVAPFLFPKKEYSQRLKIWLFIFLQILLSAMILKISAEGRYFGPAAICAALFGFGVLLGKFGFLRKLQYAFLLLGLLINIPLDLLYKNPARYWFKEQDAYLKSFLPVYEWQSWANQNLPRDSKLVSLNEKQNYFLHWFSDNTVEMRSWEELIASYRSDAEGLARHLANEGYTHFHYYPKGSRFPPWYELPRNMESLNQSCVLCSKDSVIVDLTSFRGLQQ